MPVLVDERAMDVESMIALWLAINGGDPAPDVIGTLRGGLGVLTALQGTEVVGADKLRADVAGAMQRALQTL